MSGTCLPTTVAAAAPRLSGLPPAGFGNTFRHTKHANAYMLVYVRESEWDAVMCQVTEQEISAHVRARLKVRRLTDRPLALERKFRVFEWKPPR